MIELNSKEAMNHPYLQRFVTVKKNLSGFRPLRIDQIEDDSLLPFQDNLIITRKLKDDEDFVIDYWGEKNVEMYGADLTGSTLLSEAFGEHGNFFFTMDCQVITQGVTIYLNGTFDWIGRPEQAWFLVGMPLLGPDGVKEVINCTSFERSI